MTMKHLLHYIIIPLLTAFCVACSSSPDDDLTSAAMDIYNQYADHSEQLTVAFVGDYQADGREFNAVMLQAQDSAEWEWVKGEFGVMSMPQYAMMDIMSGLPEGVQVMGGLSLDDLPEGVQLGGTNEMVIGTYFVDSNLHFDSDEERMAYADSMALEIMKQAGIYDENDSTPQVMVVNVGKGDALPEGLAERIGQQQRVGTFTRDHGEAGYVLRVDELNQTLWLFFYKDNEDQIDLLKHFKNKPLITKN